MQQHRTEGGGTGPIEVRCHDFTRRFDTVASAEHWVTTIVACRHQHQIIDHSGKRQRIVKVLASTRKRR